MRHVVFISLMYTAFFRFELSERSNKDWKGFFSIQNDCMQGLFVWYALASSMRITQTVRTELSYVYVRRLAMTLILSCTFSRTVIVRVFGGSVHDDVKRAFAMTLGCLSHLELLPFTQTSSVLCLRLFVYGTQVLFCNFEWLIYTTVFTLYALS